MPNRPTSKRTFEGNSDVFMYRFAQERPNSKSLRAYHGAELPYVFDTHDEWLPTTSEDRTVSKEMKTAWINFARSGNPVKMEIGLNGQQTLKQ